MTSEWRLFVDDERVPENVGWASDGQTVIARSSKEAEEVVRRRGIPRALSLDHDLGGADTAMVLSLTLIDGHFDSHWDLAVLREVQIHSANPVGAANLLSLWESFLSSEGIDIPVTRVWPIYG